MTSRLSDIVDHHVRILSRPPVVLVDMDEVLCRWDAHFVASHRAAFPEIAIADAGLRESFDLFAGLNDVERAAMLTVLNRPGFFAELLPVDGAVDAVAEMRAAGIDVAVCTSPWLSNPTCASDKFRWVAEHLGPEMAEATIITRDKTRVRGDVLIDDKPQITGSAVPEWDLIRFTFHYNRDLPGARIDGWSGWQGVVAEVLESRLQRSAAVIPA